MLPAVGETRDERLGVSEGVPNARGETEGGRLPETQPLLARERRLMGASRRQRLKGRAGTSGERLELSAPLLVRLLGGVAKRRQCIARIKRAAARSCRAVTLYSSTCGARLRCSGGQEGQRQWAEGGAKRELCALLPCIGSGAGVAHSEAQRVVRTGRAVGEGNAGVRGEPAPKIGLLPVRRERHRGPAVAGAVEGSGCAAGARDSGIWMIAAGVAARAQSQGRAGVWGAQQGAVGHGAKGEVVQCGAGVYKAPQGKPAGAGGEEARSSDVESAWRSMFLVRC